MEDGSKGPRPIAPAYQASINTFIIEMYTTIKALEILAKKKYGAEFEEAKAEAARTKPSWTQF